MKIGVDLSGNSFRLYVPRSFEQRQNSAEFHNTTKTDAQGRFEIGTPLQKVTYVGINGVRTDGRMPVLVPGWNLWDYVLRLRRGRHVAAPVRGGPADQDPAAQERRDRP